MINKEIDDAVFELLLKHAFRDAYAREAEQMDAQAAQPVQPSEKHRKEERRYYRKLQRKPIKASSVIRGTAACLALCMSLSFGAMMMSAPVRAAMWDSVVEFFEKYIAVNLPEKSEALVVDGHTFGYIPEGFELVESLASKTMSQYRFSDGVGEFTVQFYIDTSGIKLDKENGDMQESELDGARVYWKEHENNYRTLFLIKNDQIIYVEGNVNIYAIKNIVKNLS